MNRFEGLMFGVTLAFVGLFTFVILPLAPIA